MFRKPKVEDGFLKRFWWTIVDWIGSGGLRPESLSDDGEAYVREVMEKEGGAGFILHGER